MESRIERFYKEAAQEAAAKGKPDSQFVKSWQLATGSLRLRS